MTETRMRLFSRVSQISSLAMFTSLICMCICTNQYFKLEGTECLESVFNEAPILYSAFYAQFVLLWIWVAIMGCFCCVLCCLIVVGGGMTSAMAMMQERMGYFN